MQRAFAAYQQGGWAEAERLCRAMLAANGNHFAALNLLGIIAAQTRRTQQAVELLSRAVAVEPNNADAHYNRGNALFEQKRLAEALDSYQRALMLQPTHAGAHYNRGNVFRDLARHEEALDSYRQAIALRPTHADAYNNRGNVLRGLRRHEEALESYRRALDLEPTHAEACNNRGNVLSDMKRYAEALESFQRALAIKPDYADPHNNRGNVLLDLGRPAEALESFQRALAVDPDHAPAHLNLGMCRLLLGDFAPGWQEFEWRLKRGRRADLKRGFAEPRWLGAQSLQGKTILLYAEQGLGDTLQFCRYVKDVAALGATVLLEVQPALARLLADLDGVTQVLPSGSSLPAFDFHCPLLSLPLAFKTTLETVPADVPYLKCDGGKSAHWRQKLGIPPLARIGLAWSGGSRPDDLEFSAVNERRNIPLSDLEGLDIPGVEFYSLQKGDDAIAQLRRLQSASWNGPRIIDHTDDFDDLSDTAAFIDNLDLVISVDTAVAHLAGAMGKPTWILNRHDTCWRWLLERADSPWYPSVRLFRQPESGDWASVVGRVRRELEREFGAR